MKIDADTAAALNGVDPIGDLLTGDLYRGAIFRPTVTGATPQPILGPTLPEGTQRYQVVRGDTLGRIASRYGVTVAAIASANAIANVNQIRVGQVLVIPSSSVVATEGSASWRTIPGPSETREPPVVQQTVPKVAAPQLPAAPTSGTGAGAGGKSLTDLLNSDPLNLGVPAWALGGGLLAVVGLTMANNRNQGGRK